MLGFRVDGSRTYFLAEASSGWGIALKTRAAPRLLLTPSKAASPRACARPRWLHCRSRPPSDLDLRAVWHRTHIVMI
jgi:hypothetical protein